jgi:hypothetical protein
MNLWLKPKPQTDLLFPSLKAGVKEYLHWRLFARVIANKAAAWYVNELSLPESQL